MKTVIDFMKDLEEVQQIMVEKNTEVEGFYLLLDEGIEDDPAKREFIDSMISKLGVPADSEATLAMVTRLVSMRDDSMIQVLKKAGKSDAELEEARQMAYQWVADFYLKRHESFLDELDKRDLLTEFYRRNLLGLHRTGLAFTRWQPKWTSTIINGVNQELSEEFDGDGGKVVHYLADKGLIDLGHEGKPGDRCYSVLQKVEGEWESHSYSDVFKVEVADVVVEMKHWRSDIMDLDDRTFHEKQAWVDYLHCLIVALEETNVHKLVEKWADVDRSWMQISGPIQPGHPLEYYEDHFRQAVALEWDVRIANPEHSTKGVRKQKVDQMAHKFYKHMEVKSPVYDRLLDFASDKLESVQLHIGRVGMFYGADFCGLPSAQVVPNDEVVSKESGKKIFAFPDNILQILRSRPFVRLSREVFSKDFLTESRKLIFQDRELWFHIYDITTIGHEYGHILWVGEDSEATMNVGGHYKNVEEWKATTGGLMAFFMDEDPAITWDLKKMVISDTIKRSVGLIGWRETSEVLPYYIESMIHLQGLFDTGILDFSEDAGLSIDLTEETYEKMRSWYFETYEDLVKNFYMPKNDPTPFVEKYTRKDGKYYMPAEDKIHAMATWYWDLYQKYGREVDTTDHKDNYRPFDD